MINVQEVQEVYADLAGVREVAAQLGVKASRVRRWIERRESTGCPDPVCRFSCGDIYSMTAWRGWFALWRVTRQPALPDRD